MEYHVTWNIDIEAESVDDAARLAREIQLDPDSLATSFIVRDSEGNDRQVWTDSEDPS